MKRCPIFTETKPLEDFGTSAGKRATYGRQAYCKPCAKLNSQLRWHNMTIEQYYNLLIAQEGKCRICQEYMLKPEIDHDHGCCSEGRSCGRCTRGLLCRDCNRTIGWARDDPDRLMAAAAYLLQSKGVMQEDAMDLQ